MPAIVSRSEQLRWLAGLLAGELPRVIFLLSTMQSACSIICIDCGEGKSGGTQVTSEPTVMVFDYLVSDPASSVTYANGCGVAERSDDLSSAIVANIPLDVEYELDIASVRFEKAGLIGEHDSGYFCQLPFEESSVKYINPACYGPLSTLSSYELISASLMDATGQARISAKDYWITGRSSDVEKFRLRSRAYGIVQVSYAAWPCLDTIDSTNLLTVHSP
jgi:hypothetical protein